MRTLFGRAWSGGRLPTLAATQFHLAATLLLMAVLTLGGALWPLGDDTPVALWFAVTGLLLVVGGALVLLRARAWLLPTALTVAVAGACVLIAGSRTPEGVVIVSLGPILAAQFSAYAFNQRAALMVAGASCLAVTVGMIASPVPFVLVTWGVLMVMTALSSSMLGYTTYWLRRHATTDDLTSTLSRGALMSRLEVELAEAARTRAPLSVVAIDVDDFKRLNDTHGHLVGDEVLAALGAHWRAHLDRREAVGRTGGDEFLVILPGRTGAQARAWVETVRPTSRTPWSAGVAQAGADDDLRSLLDHADVALYAEKAAARERRTVA